MNVSYLLLILVPLSILTGILFPDLGIIFEPYLLFLLGILLFVNLIKLDLEDLVHAFASPRKIIILSIGKIILIPLLLFVVTYFIFPEYSLSVMLLSGISTGLGAPFVVNFVGGKLATIVGVIIISSIAVIFVLPSLIFILFGAQLSISIPDMILLLSIGLLVPIFAGWLTKKYLSKIAKTINQFSLPISLIPIILINFTVFAKFSEYFYTDSFFVLQTVMISFVLFAVYGLFGLILSSKSAQDRITGVIAMTYVNNILVVVFAQQFFDTQTAALAAFYNIPYYCSIFILRKLYPEFLKL